MGKDKYLIFGLIFGILFLSYNSVFAQSSSKEATVISVKGDVKIQKAGKVEWLDAKVGLRLSDGDTAKTKKASEAEISFDRDNRNVVRLAENTTAILRGRQLRQIELPEGRIRFLIRKLRRDSSFEIRTPTAVAGARGTGGDVESEPDRAEVKAFEDEVFVQSFDQEGNLIKEIIVREGWETFIEKFQAPSELVELTETDRKDWDSWKEDLTERTELEREEKGAETGAEPISGAPQEQTQQIEQTQQEQSEYKDQIFETQEIERVEDRAASGETSSGRGGSTGSGGGGSGGGRYPN